MQLLSVRIGMLVLIGTLSLPLLGCGSPDTSAPSNSMASDKPSDSDPAYAAEMVTALTQAMKNNAVPGLVILVRSPKGDWTTTLGTREIGTRKPWTVGDHFRIGSNTKTMTSTVILQLVDEGKIALTDSVSKYVPGVPNGDKITIANLAEMRSGLYSYTYDAKFNRTLDDDPKKAWSPRELLNIALSHPVNAPPDTEFDYCNTNIVLLGLIIEKLTGMSASEAFRKRIFEPLGLKQTSLPHANDWSIPEPHPHGYQFLTNVETIASYAVPKSELSAALNGRLKPLDYTGANPSWAWTAGGAISTADDLATYVKALVGGGLLSPATQKLRLDSIRKISSNAATASASPSSGPCTVTTDSCPAFPASWLMIPRRTPPSSSAPTFRRSRAPALTRRLCLPRRQ